MGTLQGVPMPPAMVRHASLAKPSAPHAPSLSPNLIGPAMLPARRSDRRLHHADTRASHRRRCPPRRRRRQRSRRSRERARTDLRPLRSRIQRPALQPALSLLVARRCIRARRRREGSDVPSRARPWSDGTSPVDLAPLALIARLAALVVLFARRQEDRMPPGCS
jgi:hypothetical protein